MTLDRAEAAHRASDLRRRSPVALVEAPPARPAVSAAPGAGADVAFYLEDLAGGGVQVVFLRLATALAERGRRVELWVAAAGGRLAECIPAEIAIVPIPASSRLRAAVGCARSARRLTGVALRAALWNRGADTTFLQLEGLAEALVQRRPGALVAATPYRNLEALLARERVASPTRVFASEHNDLRSGHALAREPYRTQLARLQPHLYPRADGIVAVSEGVAEDVARRSGLPRDRITVIYNPAVPPDLAVRTAEAVEHPWLRPGEPPLVLAVGRLGAAKDLPTLVRAFARLRATQPARLMILGSERSPKKTAKRIGVLRALAAELGVAADIEFHGYAANPFAWMARAAVLAVSSRNEGFCNVIAEALACGCPVVSTDCPSGPAEILGRGRHGRLVPVGDDAGLAAALAATLAEPHATAAMRARAEHFTVESAARAYERLLWPDAAGPAA